MAGFCRLCSIEIQSRARISVYLRVTGNGIGNYVPVRSAMYDAKQRIPAGAIFGSTAPKVRDWRVTFSTSAIGVGNVHKSRLTAIQTDGKKVC
jgi:hypothetical protein